MNDASALAKLQADWQRKHSETLEAERELLKYYLGQEPTRPDLMRRLQVVEIALGLQDVPSAGPAPEIDAAHQIKRDALSRTPKPSGTTPGERTLPGPNAVPDTSAAISTKQLYRFASTYFLAALRRTPPAIIGRVKRRLQIAGVASGLQDPPAPARGQKGEEASQTDRDFQADAAEMEARSRWVEHEPDFAPIMELARPYTMTSVERMFAMHQAVRYLEEARIEGAIVECGVWRGGSIMIAIATLNLLKSCGREIFLFDTFEGLPKPDPILDVDIWDNKGHDGWILEARNAEASNWAYASLNDVRSNVLGLGYPEKLIHFVKGMVERTIPGQSPDKIALLRLDTDWHSSTKHVLENLFPALVPGGVLIMDDYGHFMGARKAADDYFNERGIRMLLNRTDYSGRMGIKPA
jgi:O-methyltransferase